MANIKGRKSKSSGTVKSKPPNPPKPSKPTKQKVSNKASVKYNVMTLPLLNELLEAFAEAGYGPSSNLKSCLSQLCGYSQNTIDNIYKAIEERKRGGDSNLPTYAITTG